MEEVAPKVPSVKIVLFGPENSGKTAFSETLLIGKIQNQNYVPTEKTVTREVMRQFYKKIGNRYVPTETYKLIIADTPGSIDKKNERYKGIQKSIGIILFYDTTDPNSAEQLAKMLEEEIIKPELYYNLMGIVIVGTKKDLNVNSEAISKAQTKLNHLIETIQSLWGYKIPHLIISNLNQNEVGWAFYVLESLIMDKPPMEIINTLSVEALGIETKLAEAPQMEMQPTETAKPVVETPTIETQIEQQPEIPPKTPTEIFEPEIKAEAQRAEPTVAPPKEEVTIEKPVKEAIEQPQAITREALKFEETQTSPLVKETIKVRIHPSEKIWMTLRKLVNSKRDEIVEALFFRKTEDGLYAAFYPGERVLDEAKKTTILESLKFEEIGDKIAESSGIGEPQLYIVMSKEKSILIVKRKEALLIVKTRSRPSDELINLLV
ncbi:MAG: GTP-binding protein [Candidatus Njordarchaeia archaeon]